MTSLPNRLTVALLAHFIHRLIRRCPGKPRHHFVDLSADVSRPYRFIVTPQICLCGLSPGGSLVLALCRVVAGAAGLDSTRSSAFRTEVQVMLTGAERSRMVWNARGADTPGAFCCLA
jgi:hypothetical protein